MFKRMRPVGLNIYYVIVLELSYTFQKIAIFDGISKHNERKRMYKMRRIKRNKIL